MTGPVLYGAPLQGVSVVEVPVSLAALFAAAHHRLRPEAAGVHLGDGEVRITHPAPTAPDGGTDRWVPPPDEVVAAVREAERPVVLAGPGVVRHEAVPGLAALAAAASLGVLNTWGAKGAFDWRSRHHLATVGLQERDFVLAGLAEADLIVATGVDAAEASADWRLAPVVEVHPWSLAPLAEVAGRGPRTIPMPPLRDELARVTQAGWARPGAPLAPTQATRTYGTALAGTGLVAADPGPAGFWVARTLPTSGLRGALVSATADDEGSAVATAVVARLLDPRRPVLVVLDRVGERSRAGLEVAEGLGLSLPVEVWGDEGDVLDADAHGARLPRLLAEGGTAHLAPDRRQIDELVAVAGPVVAWGS